MIKLVIFISVFFVNNFLFSQVDETKNFLYNIDKEIIYKDKIEFRKPEFREPYFFVDSQKYAIKDVLFYKNETGFFAKYESDFIKRVSKGKLNFYESPSKKLNFELFSGTDALLNYRNVKSSELYIKPNSLYNIGFDTLKKANFENLKVDLISNFESSKLLKKHHNSKIKEKIFFAIGGLLYAGASVYMFQNIDSLNEKTFIPVYITAATGATFLIGGFINNSNKKKKFRQAIVSFNK